MQRNKSIFFFLPFGPPSSGGCAQYYEYLRENLSELSELRHIHVVTDIARVRECAISERCNGKFIHRVLVGFSFFKNRYVRGLAFRAQMLQILILIIFYSLFFGKSIYVLHSGYFSKNMFFCSGLRLLATFLNNLRIVIDFRDTSVSEVQLDAVESSVAGAIFCSINIGRMYEKWFVSREKTFSYIPVPFESNPLHESALSNENEDLALKDYIFFPSGIDRKKGFFLVMKAIELLRARGRELTLLVVGRNTAGGDWEKRLPPFVKYLGPVSNSDCRALMSKAECVVCLGADEGLPRICLEAISTGARLLAPFGVPELSNLCAPAPTSDLTPDQVAALLYFESNHVNDDEFSYDLRPHSFANVNEEYKSFFCVLDK